MSILPDATSSRDENTMRRAKAHDPFAHHTMGMNYYNEQKYESAFRLFTKAALLGNAEVHFRLATLYHEGKVVENDGEKETYHLKEAAIGGHPEAWYNLAIQEGDNGRPEIAVKHLVIAANLGDARAMGRVMVLSVRIYTKR